MSDIVLSKDNAFEFTVDRYDFQVCDGKLVLCDGKCDNCTVDEMIDLIEVVRCKDCEFRNGCESGKGDVCDYSAVYVHPNGFCNWGKRRETDG